MAKTTFWDIIERTIEKVGVPLSSKEVWDRANEVGNYRKNTMGNDSGILLY
jgi:hypothetical protein